MWTPQTALEHGGLKVALLVTELCEAAVEWQKLLRPDFAMSGSAGLPIVSELSAVDETTLRHQTVKALVAPAAGPEDWTCSGARGEQLRVRAWVRDPSTRIGGKRTKCGALSGWAMPGAAV